MARPALPLKKEAMEAYLRFFAEECPKSKAVVDEAKKYIPSGNDPAVRDQVIEVIKRVGPSTGLFHEFKLALAKEINRHMPAVEMFRMLGSGTEAVMAAIRVARLATGNRNVVKVGGAYHGWSDQLVYSLKIPKTRRFDAHGIPASLTRLTKEAAPDGLGSLERVLAFNRLRGGTACVLVEPVGPESGTRPVAFEYNKGVRALCEKYGALLVFDEVVTAFRIGLEGAQGYFGVKPDLTCFGKIIAGGYPSAGGLGGGATWSLLILAIVTYYRKYLYKRRREIDAIIHTHSMSACTVAAARLEVPPILDDLAQIVGPSLRVADYSLPGSAKMSRTVLRALRGRMAALMANYGAVALGRTMDEALICARVLEKCCRAFIQAEFLGGAKPLNRVEAALMHDVYLRNNSKKNIERSRPGAAG